MSFKDEYKTELDSVSPDTEKIIKRVHERLDENAPLKISTNRRKKSVWSVIAPVTGAAACVALCCVVIFNVLPFISNTNDGNGICGAANGSPEMSPAPDGVQSDLISGISSESSHDDSSEKPGAFIPDENVSKYTLIFGENGQVQTVNCNGVSYNRTDRKVTVRNSLIAEDGLYNVFLTSAEENEYIILSMKDDECICVVENNSDFGYLYRKDTDSSRFIADSTAP